METITMYGTYNYTNDTKLTFTKTKNRAEIKLEYTDEDPDYGTETLVCGGDAKETLISLCHDQLDELTTFLDETNDGTYRPEDIMCSYKHLDDLNNSSLIAFERMLQSIVGEGVNRKINFGTNKNGHRFVIGSIQDVADDIREAFVKHEVKSVYIAHDVNEDDNDVDEQEGWSKIIALDLPFDNMPHELALLMGYCGGGGVELAYSYDDSDTSCFTHDIALMISNCTGNGPTSEVYVEFIGVNDKHSYENTDR